MMRLYLGPGYQAHGHPVPEPLICQAPRGGFRAPLVLYRRLRFDMPRFWGVGGMYRIDLVGRRTLLGMCPIGIAALCMTLTGCTSHKTEEASPASLREYILCNIAASKAVASQQGDPASLAIAARGLCAQEEIDLLNELKIARGDQLQTYRLLDAYKRGAAESNITEIARARGRSSLVRP